MLDGPYALRIRQYATGTQHHSRYALNLTYIRKDASVATAFAASELFRDTHFADFAFFFTYL